MRNKIELPIDIASGLEGSIRAIESETRKASQATIGYKNRVWVVGSLLHRQGKYQVKMPDIIPEGPDRAGHMKNFFMNLEGEYDSFDALKERVEREKGIELRGNLLSGVYLSISEGCIDDRAFRALGRIVFPLLGPEERSELVPMPEAIEISIYSRWNAFD